MSGGSGTGVNDGSSVALYLPTGDNDTWVTTKGGVPGDTWEYARTGLGDAGQAWVDPALHSQVLVARNSCYSLMRSADGLAPGAVAPIDLTPAGAATSFDNLTGMAGLSQGRCHVVESLMSSGFTAEIMRRRRLRATPAWLRP